MVLANIVGNGILESENLKHFQGNMPQNPPTLKESAFFSAKTLGNRSTCFLDPRLICDCGKDLINS